MGVPDTRARSPHARRPSVLQVEASGCWWKQRHRLLDAGTSRPRGATAEQVKCRSNPRGGLLPRASPDARAGMKQKDGVVEASWKHRLSGEPFFCERQQRNGGARRFCAHAHTLPCARSADPKGRARVAHDGTNGSFERMVEAPVLGNMSASICLVAADCRLRFVRARPQPRRPTPSGAENYRPLAGRRFLLHNSSHKPGPSIAIVSIS